jgi:hypothetical protein
MSQENGHFSLTNGSKVLEFEILQFHMKKKYKFDVLPFTFQITFLLYFPYHFTIQLAFLPYFPYLFTIQLAFLPYFQY